MDYNTAIGPAQTITVRVHDSCGYAPGHQDAAISYEVVNPESLSSAIVPAIDATDARNASASAVLDYVNDYNALSAVWPATAIGNSTAADNAPASAALPASYVGTGTVYHFEETYLGHTISRSLTVNEVKQSTPSLAVEYETETINTTTAMSFSTEAGIWNACTDDMSIAPWPGETVSFRTAASRFKVDSDTVEIALPPREAAPASLTAVINDEKTEITVLGLSSDTAYEYSFDGAVYLELASTGKIAVADYMSNVSICKKHVAGVSARSEAASVDGLQPASR